MYSLNYHFNPYQHSLPLYLSSFWNLCLFMQLSLQSPPKIFSPTSTIQPIQVLTRVQWPRGCCEEWHCFNLYLLPWKMDKDNSAQNYWSCVTQARKIGVLQVITSNKDGCYQNRKPITPPSPYYQALVTTPYPTNTITRFHMALKTSSLTATVFVRGLAFSYTIHTHSYPSLEILPFSHRSWSRIKN